MPERIGFVGVGRMGSNMARRLKESGFKITAVYDARHKVAKALAKELDCEPSQSLAKVTELSDVVITVVTDDRAMEEIFAPEGKSLLYKAQGRLFINCATVTPRVHIEIEQRATKAGAQSLEACMASSINQARDGTLYLMCGGEPEAFDRARPILAKLGSSLRYIGRAGMAAKVKAVVNMIMNINTAGLAEGLALGDALGLDLKMLREVLGQTGAASRVLETDGEDMVSREHSCFFSAAHAAKDSGIAVQLGKQQKLTLPVAATTKKQFDRMTYEGLGDFDKSGIAELTFRDRHICH